MTFLGYPIYQLGRSFIRTAFATSKFGLRWDEAAFASGLQDGGAVAIEVGLDALERGNRRIQPRELLLDFRDNGVLLRSRCK